MGFCQLVVGWGRRWEAVEVKSKGRCVSSSGIESVSEVHKEGVALPAEAILDKRVRELGPVK